MWSMSTLVVGGRHVSRSDALAYAGRYLTDGSGWAYPSYDAFDAEHACGPIVDADLLAPMLLNVNRISIKSYEALQRVKPRLQVVLDLIDPDMSLADAGPAELLWFEELYDVIDGDGIKGVKGTVLAKLLHRKRPAFIPLYDRQVGRVYQDGKGAPVQPVKGRAWAKFMPLFAAAVQRDLIREAQLWSEIAAIAPGPPITPLRALDIVAWWAGGPSSALAEQVPSESATKGL